MSSVLIITEVENLQNRILSEMKALESKLGIFVSFNKPQSSTQHILEEANISIDKTFFIDCVTQEKKRDDVLHIPPQDLDLLATAIKQFVKDIDGDKYLVIDALSTLLIYNDENKVARFVKEITDLSTTDGLTILSFSPRTRGEDLLKKIFNFFDQVIGR